MKLRITFSGLLLIFLLAGMHVKAQTVYILKAVKSTMPKTAASLKQKKGIELAEAKKQGYEPCSMCKGRKRAKEKLKTWS